MIIDSSKILIVSNIEQTIQELISTLPKHSVRVIKNEEENKYDFLITHAQKAIKEAYLASSSTKYILLCGATFNTEAQNMLLKVLEEPPTNIVFILITLSKSSILPTIFSRLPHQIIKTKEAIIPCELSFTKLELKDIYSFLKQHQRINKNDAKKLIESILYKIEQENIKLNTRQLETFSTAIKLLSLNSRPINILTNLLLTLIYTKSPTQSYSNVRL
jgi:DNA polymerase-3 subunit delta'